MKSVINGYELQEEIGKGEFGKVMRAKDKNGMLFAIKVIPLPNLAQNPNLQSFIANETSMLLMLNHPGIIEFIEEFNADNQLCIVYEYCDRGNLSRLIKSTGGMPEEAAVKVFVSVLESLTELEKRGVVHRDIKPENILLKGQKVKLGDFGLSTHAGQMTSRLVGSPMYMAPEAIRYSEYTAAGDVYSLGVTLYKMVTNTFPYQDNDLRKLMDKKNCFNQNMIPAGVSKEVKDLIMACLHPNPAQRMTVKQLLALVQSTFDWRRVSSMEIDLKKFHNKPAPLENMNFGSNYQPRKAINPLQKKFCLNSPKIAYDELRLQPNQGYFKPQKPISNSFGYLGSNQIHTEQPTPRRVTLGSSPLSKVFQDAPPRISQNVHNASEHYLGNQLNGSFGLQGNQQSPTPSLSQANMYRRTSYDSPYMLLTPTSQQNRPPEQPAQQASYQFGSSGYYQGSMPSPQWGQYRAN